MLPFEIDRNSKKALWIQLRENVIRLIDSGYYGPGERLPATRVLANDLSVNYNTVNKAYMSLVSDGYLTSNRGAGVRVRNLAETIDPALLKEAGSLIEDCVRACQCLGLTADEIHACMMHKMAEIRIGEDGGDIQ